MAATRHPPTCEELDEAESLTGIGAPRLLLTAKQSAVSVGRSLRTWRTWDALGLVPKPVRIGRNTFWRVEELRAWVSAGCPRRDEWEARS